MGFCCFPAGFSLDTPTPAGCHSRSPVLDASPEKWDFPGAAWDDVLAPPSSLGRVVGDTWSSHPRPEFGGGLSPLDRGEPVGGPAPILSQCQVAHGPAAWAQQWGEMWGEMWHGLGGDWSCCRGRAARGGHASAFVLG